MQTGSIGVIERSVEKLALGACGLIAAGLMWAYLLNSPNQLAYEGRSVRPSELDEAIGAHAAALEGAVRNARPVNDDIPAFSQQLVSNHAVGVLGMPDRGSRLPELLPAAAPFGAPLAKSVDDEEQTGNVVAVTPLRLESPTVRTGISLAVRRRADFSAAPAAAESEPQIRDSAAATPWVTVGGWFDTSAQINEMTARRYAPYRLRVLFCGLDVQRQQMAADGGWSPWADVTASMATPRLLAPDPAFDSATGAIVNAEEIADAYRLVMANQLELAQPGFYVVRAGDPWLPPPLAGLEPQAAPDADGQRDVRGTAAEIALASARRAYARKDYAAAARHAREAAADPQAQSSTREAAARLLKRIAQASGNRSIEPDEPWLDPTQPPPPTTQAIARRETGGFVCDPQNDQKVALWFHDDSVESGKTYRYRMRARLWNRYVGQLRAVKNVEDAKKTLLAGEWSLPTGAVTVAPNTHVFVKGARTTKQAASVDVWKWLQGRWVRESFDVGVGDTIGGVKRIKTGDTDEDGKDVKEDVDFGTGAVVLDLRFDERVKIRAAAGRKGEFTYREVTSLVLVYLDPADGQVKERVQALDRDDPLRKKLEEENES